MRCLILRLKERWRWRILDCASLLIGISACAGLSEAQNFSTSASPGLLTPPPAVAPVAAPTPASPTSVPIQSPALGVTVADIKYSNTERCRAVGNAADEARSEYNNVCEKTENLQLDELDRLFKLALLPYVACQDMLNKLRATCAPPVATPGKVTPIWTPCRYPDIPDQWDRYCSEELGKRGESESDSLFDAQGRWNACTGAAHSTWLKCKQDQAALDGFSAPDLYYVLQSDIWSIETRCEQRCETKYRSTMIGAGCANNPPAGLL